MKKNYRLKLCSAALFTLSLGQVQAAEMSISSEDSMESSVTLDMVSSYIFRGVTLNKGAAVQPGVSVSANGLTAGAWGSIALDAEESETEQELDLYVSYEAEIGNLGLTLGAVEYMYPDTDIDSDREVSIGLGLDTVLAPTLTFNYGIGGAVEETLYTELGLEHAIIEVNDVSTSLSGAIGHLSPKEGETGLSHAQISLAASFRGISTSINYFAELDEDVQSFQDGEEFFLSVGTSRTF